MSDTGDKPSGLRHRSTASSVSSPADADRVVADGTAPSKNHATSSPTDVVVDRQPQGLSREPRPAFNKYQFLAEEDDDQR